MKDLKNPRDPVELMGQAYERLLENSIEDARKLEDKTGPELHRIIDESRQKLAELGDLTKEEIDQVADYLKRDLRDAARYLSESGESFAKWLGFDPALIAERTRNLFFEAADQSTIQLRILLEHPHLEGYRTGEITGPGTLVCKNCGEELHFHKPGKIPPCPKCHGTEFARKN